MSQAVDEAPPHDPAAPLPESEVPAAEAAPETPADPVAELQAEAEKWKDLALRTAAELATWVKKRSADP